ncbi:DUF1194 domain-containing protein [Salipiger sp. P9]|uniref:DUF1194 domain-containing protein n=1 Tax=Salipiger pentaromativorans TaxID=2943193 RepID=UPI0021580A17|nr:DUF1194 domain-containing protein [Salipiger pentaromativorans]MCR8549654.1 DUF1194 domain-containing protein [Salipiger pentaromativorans]
MLHILCLCLTLCAALPARACETALLLAMDVSNSVDSAEYRLQAHGLAQALEDPEIAAILVQDRVALSVMQWAGEDRQQTAIGWVQMTRPEDVAQLAARAREMPRAFVLSDTAPASALHGAIDRFASAPDCKRRIIDVSGDGTPNSGGPTGAARQRAERAGITVNGLAIEAPGRGLAITNFYHRALITRDGFVMTARGHQSFAETLRRKMLREISRVTG